MFLSFLGNMGLYSEKYIELGDCSIIGNLVILEVSSSFMCRSIIVYAIKAFHNLWLHLDIMPEGYNSRGFRQLGYFFKLPSHAKITQLWAKKSTWRSTKYKVIGVNHCYSTVFNQYISHVKFSTPILLAYVFKI